MMKNLAFASLLALGLGGLAACGEADEVIDCAQICNRYDECVDDDFDTSGCVDQCEENADADDDGAFADQLDVCESCLDDQDSCAEDIVCADECAVIIIASS